MTMCEWCGALPASEGHRFCSPSCRGQASHAQRRAARASPGGELLLAWPDEITGMHARLDRLLMREICADPDERAVIGRAVRELSHEIEIAKRLLLEREAAELKAS